jgi:hypothetical protein
VAANNREAPVSRVRRCRWPFYPLARRLGDELLEAAAGNPRGVPYAITLHDAWWLCGRQFMIDREGRYCGQTKIEADICGACVENRKRKVERTRRACSGVVFEPHAGKQPDTASGHPRHGRIGRGTRQIDADSTGSSHPPRPRSAAGE